MKRYDILHTFLFLLVLLPVTLFSQVPTMTVTGTNTVFFGKTICSGSASDNPKITITANLNPPIVSSTVATIFLEELNGSTVISTTDLNATLATFTSKSVGVWHVELGNNEIKTTFQNVNNQTETKTVGFNRKDGSFRFKIAHSDGVQPLNQFTLNFIITEGTEPWVRISKANASVTWGSAGPSHHQILEDCVNNDPRIRVYPNGCGLDGFRIIAGEWNMTTNTYVGTPANRILSTSEINDMISSAGFPINGFSDGTNTISLSPNKYYHITVVYTGQNTWKTSYNLMHYKEGDFDLAMRNNALDTGFEPFDQWDNDVFRSLDLWNKRSNSPFPNTKGHEDPTFATISGNHNRLMVEIENLGCNSSPENVPLRLFWTRARTDELWSKHWIYDVTSSDPNAYPDPNNSSTLRPAGSEITINGATQTNPYNTQSNPYLIPSIPGGGTHTISFADGVQWYPPDPTHYDVSSGTMKNANPVICLLARINEPNSPEDPIRFEPTGTTDKILPYVKENNNVVTRNTIVVANPGFFKIDPNGGWNYGFSTVVVNNDSPNTHVVDICFDQLTDGNTVGTFLDYGSIEIGMTPELYESWELGGSYATNITSISPSLFEMTNGSHGCIENIEVYPGSYEQIGLRFQYDGNYLPASPLQFNYQMSQEETLSESTASGSSTIFIVDVPANMPSPSIVSNTNELASEKELLIYPNPAQDFIDIHFNLDNSQGVLYVYDISGRISLKHIIDRGLDSTQINISDLESGIYTVKFVDKDGALLVNKFVKE